MIFRVILKRIKLTKKESQKMSGRPKSERTMHCTFTLRLDAETYKVLQDIATHEEVPLSYVVRRVLRKGLSLAPRSVQQVPENDIEAIASDWE